MTDVMENQELPEVDVWGSHGVANEAVTVEMMKDRGKLLTVEDVMQRLAVTEPLVQIGFDSASFKVDADWNTKADVTLLDGEDVVAATMKCGGIEYPLTYDALLEATSAIGITQAYTAKAPAFLTNDALNYWFNHKQPHELKLLSMNGTARALTRATITPFSNVRFVEEACAAIEAKYPGVEVLVDSKFSHSLRKTYLRMVVPEIAKDVQSARNHDHSPDTWSGGISFTNSLIGLGQTEISAYLFAWLCANGAIATQGDTKWNRRRGGQGDEVYDWMRITVDDMLGQFDHEFEKVENLVGIGLAGHEEEVSRTLTDIFTEYKVPVAARERIILNMTDSDDLSMYGVMQAITMAANMADSPDGQVETLMRVGGDLAMAEHSRCAECHRLSV
jgi:hypothetical protein